MTRFLDRLLIALIVVVCLGLLFLVAKSGASTIVAPAGSTVPYQRWADEAKVPTPDLTIAVVEDNAFCGGGEGCTGEALPIYLDPAVSAKQLRENFLHELGHQFDYAVLTDALRSRFSALIGDPRPWEEGPNSPHEKFAEAFKDCALQPRPTHRLSTYGYQYNPRPRLEARICRLIAAAA